MIVHKDSAVKIFETDGVVGLLLNKSDYGECVKLEIQPGAILKKHRVDFAATFYVICGEGVFLSKKGENEIRQGSIMVADANTERGFANTGREVLEVLVIKHL
ncbi:MAG: hypothetical protein Kow0029_03460 [Candidatus Rifleibacteriota bacterium]